MTSRRYSELNNLDTTIENDENSINTDLGTPRSKAVPSKKTRVSNSPFNFHQQNAPFNPDKNLEETFLEKTVIPEDPQLSHKPLDYKPDKNLEETYFEQSTLLEQTMSTTQEPSLLESIKTPDFSKLFDSTLLRSPIDMSLDETIGNSQDKTLNDGAQSAANTSIDQSSLSLPFNFNHQKVQLFNESFNALSFKDLYTITEVDSQGLDADQSIILNKTQTSTVSNTSRVISKVPFVEPEPTPVAETAHIESLEEEKHGDVSKAALFSEFEVPIESPQKSASVPPQGRTTPNRFGQPLTNAANISASMASFLEEEMQIFAEEPCKCDQFSSMLNEYKKICEKESNRKNTPETQSLQEQIMQLNDLLAEAKYEADLSQKEAANSKKDSEDFQFALDEEKRRSKSRISDLQNQNFSLSEELETLKNTLIEYGDVEAMKDELFALKEKLKVFDEVVSKGAEIEVLFNKVHKENKALSAENAGLLQQKASEQEIFHSTKAENEILKTENEMLKTENSEFVTRMTSLESEKAGLEAHLKNANDQLVKLQATCDEFKKNSEDFQLALDEEKRHSESCTRDLKNLTVSLSEELETLKNTVIEHGDVDAMKNELFDLKEKLKLFDEAVSKSAEMEVLYNTVQEENKALSAENDSLLQQLTGATEMFHSTKAQNEMIKIENSEFANRMTSLEAQKVALEAELKTANVQIGNLQATCDEFKKDIEGVQVALGEEKRHSESRISDLQKQNFSLSNELEILKNTLIEHGDVDAMKNELLELKEKLKVFDDAVSKSAEFEKLFNEAQEKNKSLSAENDSLLQQKASGKKMFHSIKAENETLKTEKSEFVNRMASLEAEKAALEAELKIANDQTGKFQATCDKLKKDIEKLNEALDESESAQKEASEQMFALSAKLSKLTNVDGSTPRAVIDMAEIVSPTQMNIDNDGSFHSITEEPEPILPNQEEEKTPKRKESLKSKLASPFRRTKRDPPSTPRQQPNSSQNCVQQ